MAKLTPQISDRRPLRCRVGHVAGLILDESWVVRYVIVAGNGIGVQGVVVAVGWIQKIDWASQRRI